MGTIWTLSSFSFAEGWAMGLEWDYQAVHGSSDEVESALGEDACERF